MRTCIVTRERQDKSLMIRFVVGPQGYVVPDIRACLPGRGVWIVARKQLILQAVQKNLFQRGFKKPVKVDAGLATEVEMLLEKAALGSLGFTRKASQCVTGATKVTAALGSGKVIALIHAREASDEGLKKIAKGAPQDDLQHKDRGGVGTTGYCVFRNLTSEQLNMALGGTNVIHAALVKGGAAQSFVEKMNALENYRGSIPTDETEQIPPADGMTRAQAE